MAKDLYFKFKCLNGSDFSLVFMVDVEGKTFNVALQKTLKKLKKVHKIDANIDLELIEAFEVPDNQKAMFFSLLSRGTNKAFKKLKKRLIKDGIRIIRDYLTDVKYVRSVDGWKVILTFGGQYLKE